MSTSTGPQHKGWQTLGVAACVGAAAAVLYYLITGLLTPDTPPSGAQSKIVLHEVVGQGEHGTKLGWRFVADSTELSSDGSTTVYHHVRTGTYYRDERPAYNLTADEIVLDNRSLSYSGKGVHIWAVGKTALKDLKSADVLWNNSSQALLCPSTVRVNYKGSTLVTSSLTANFITGATVLGKTQIDVKQ